MLLARTKGLTRSQATIRHAMRNSMVPVFPMILGEFVGILGGSLIIETIFGVPGVGQLYLNSITARDYNFFMLLSAFYTLIGLVSGLVVDISYGLSIRESEWGNDKMARKNTDYTNIPKKNLNFLTAAKQSMTRSLRQSQLVISRML